ncbi:MAG: hypothetical protein RLY87_989 [Chloroflexota bacterium]
MKIAVIGAGGVGAYLGAVLGRAGHPVALVARGDHAHEMAVNGITVHSPTGSWVARPAMVTDDAATVGVADVVLICLKTYHLDACLQSLSHMIGPRTIFLTLQNGVDAYSKVAACVGAERTVPGLIYCELSVEAPGVIRSGIEPVRLTYGAIPPHPVTTTAQAFVQACTQAGIAATCVADGRMVVWSKAIFVAAMSAVTTVAGVPMGALQHNPEVAVMLTAALTEARTVAEAEGIIFTDDPVASALSTAAAMPADARSSMARDYVAGRPLELEALSGAIVLRGRALGVPTPVNQALYALLRLRVAARSAEARNV